MRKLKLLLVLCLVAIAANANKTVYLAPGPWDVDGARYALYMFGNDEKWVDFADSNSDGIYEATFEDTYTKIILCQMDGSNSTNDWPYKLHQTADLAAPVVDGMTYTITSTEGAYTLSGNTIYLYNVGAEKFLCSGNNWGSHASVGEGGIPLTLEVGNGIYRISTAHLYTGKYLNGEWMDSDTSDWTFVLDGSGNYKIKNGDNFLYYNSGTLVSCGADPGTTASQWKVYTEAERIAAMADATKASPVNATFLIKNHYFAKGNGSNVTSSGHKNRLPSHWSGDNMTDIWGVDASSGANYCSEQYRKTFDNYQVLSDIPNGKYLMKAKGFYRNDGGGYAVPYIYAGTQKCNLKTKGDDITDLTTAATAFLSDSYLLDGVTVYVNDGTLRVGVKSDAGIDWCGFDDFSLQYYGKTISNVAVALPDGGAMAAGKWYYFNLPQDSKYDITATTFDDIVYTTDGSVLKEDEATITANFSGSSEIDLNEGRYYIKSSSNNNFAIVAHVKTYSLGDVTAQSIADDSYIGSLTTFVLTYGDAATNDGEASLAVIGSAKASLKKNGAEVATGTLTANDAAKTLTATFSDITLATNANDYSIVIPAGAFGYEGQSVNVEVIVPFQTGLVADGLYYLQKKDTQKYLGRGGNYGTRAVVADLGISFELNVQTNGKYYLKNHDQSLAAAAGRYFGKVGDPYYTDATSAQAFIIASADGGYYLRPDADNYFKTTTESTDIDVPFDYIDVTATEGDAIIWVPISKEAYAANIAAVRNAEAAAIATSAGETAASVSALETLLADAEKFKAVDMTSSIEGAECKAAADISEWMQVKYAIDGQTDFNANGTCGEVWSGIGGIKQEITGLAEGIYKVSVHATWRPGGKESGKNAGNEINTNAWVYANTATSSNLTQLKSWYAGGATIDNRAGMAASGDTYLNDVYVYVSDGETLTIGLASPTECNGAWLPFFGWSLTYYKPKATFTASFVNGEKWDDVYAYVWNGGVEITDEFPGEKISKSSTYRRNGIDYDVYTYSYTGFEDPANIIFSDGASAVTTNKTADLTFVDGMTDLSKVPYIAAYAVVGGNNGDLTDEAYKAFFSNTWDAATQTDILTKVSEGVYSKTYSDLTLDKQTISYKVIQKQYLEASSATEWYDNGTGKNLTIDIPVKGIYDITFTFTVSGSVISGVATKSAEAVTISDKRWATTVTNSPLDFSGENFEAYTATVDGSNVVLTKVDDVQAETGVVLKLKDGEDPDTFYVPVIASSETDKGSLMFSSIYGFDIYASYTDNYYGLIVKTVDEKEVAMFALIGKPIGDGKVTIPAGKAFLAVPTTARELSVVFSDDETTGIRSIDNGQLDNIYDLQGRKVAQPTKGLYIVNGKKVVKK